MSLAGLVLTALLSADPCAEPPAASAKPDAQLAGAYVRVGRDEEDAGSAGGAKLAYAQALSLDPSNVEAREGLRRVCGKGDGAALREEAVEKMEAGDRVGAIYLLRKSRAAGESREADLLEGILQYELGDDARALPLLRSAAQDPAFAASAELFQGLISLRAGDSASAAERFAAVSQAEDPAISSSARNLLRMSRREGRLVLSAFLEAGYDSNVDLSPGASLFTPGDADAFGGVALSALIRPWRRGPYLLLNGGYRAQTRLIQDDTGVAGALLGWQLGDLGPRIAAEYELGFVSFGGDPYQVSHALNVRGALPLGRWQLAAESVTRLESFVEPELAAYSGVREVARLLVGVSPLTNFFAEAGYAFTRDAAVDPALAYVEHGPSLRLRWQPVQPVRLSLGADYRARTFDVVDPDLGVARNESVLSGTLRGELELGDTWTLYAAAEAWRASSTLAELGYVRFVGSAGVALARGVW